MPKISAHARALVAELPVFDAHVDSIQRALDLGHDLGERGRGQLDLVRGREGGLGAVVLVCWVDPSSMRADGTSYMRADGTGGAERTHALLDAVHALAAQRSDQVRLATNGRELDEARAQGRIAAIAGIEGGHSIEESLDELRCFFERGVRVMTLVWNNHLRWIRSCQDGAGPDVPAGLSAFGRDVVREMNRLGIVVDLSHAGERSFYDALETTSRPPIASHSGCKALHDHPRNLDDAQLRALAAAGGVVGVVFHPGFLDARARAEEQRVRDDDAYRRIAGRNATDTFLLQSEHMQRAAEPLRASRVLDHVLHAIDVAGIDHVGIGSDYDGIQRAPAGLEDASCYGRLADMLLAHGCAEDDVRKVLGGNMERVFAAVTGPGTLAHDARTVASHGGAR